VVLFIFLGGCGDYVNQEVPTFKLEPQQKAQLSTIVVINLMCSAISRYSNDIVSPIEGESYSTNAKTAHQLLSNYHMKYENSDGKVTHEKAIKLFEMQKKKVFSLVATDLNNLGDRDLQSYYDMIFEKIGQNKEQFMLGVNLHDCSDVSVVTRRMLDPYFM
jgi:hypothetical protein